MAIGPHENEIQRLVRFYRKSIENLSHQIETIDFERPRAFIQTQQVVRILDDLDDQTERWAGRNISGLFKASSREARRLLKKWNVPFEGATQAFNLVNEQSIQALLIDPEIGFLSNMRGAVQQVRDRMKTIRNQAKMLVGRQRLFDETIARTGFLEGRNINTIRDHLVDEMVKFKGEGQLLFTSKAARLPASQIISNVANLPHIKIPTAASATGFRRLRVDRYAEMLARTKTGQAANLARRNEALQHKVELMQISKNKPLQNDACFIYIGKVFALTPAAKQEYGVPMIHELPNGGPPFHPNCTHQELLWVPEYRSEKERRLAMVSPPKWALNKTWSQVEHEYRKRGGATGFSQSAAAKRLGVDTGGRQRRGYGDESGKDSGHEGFRKHPQKPTVEDVTSEDLSNFRQQIGRAVAPQARDVVTKSGLSKSIEGLNSPAFSDMVNKQARGLIDDALSGFSALNSRAREAILADMSPKIAKDAIDYARGEFAFGHFQKSAKKAIHARGNNFIYEGKNLDHPKNLAVIRKGATEDIIPGAPKGLKLSDDLVDAQAQRAVDDVFDDVMKPLKTLNTKMAMWLTENEDEIRAAADEMGKALVFNSHVFTKEAAIKELKEEIKHIVSMQAQKTIDSPEAIMALGKKMADDFGKVSILKHHDMAVDMFSDINKKANIAQMQYTSKFIVSSKSANPVAEEIWDKIVETKLSQEGIKSARSMAVYRGQNGLRGAVENIEGVDDLPLWLQQQFKETHLVNLGAIIDDKAEALTNSVLKKIVARQNNLFEINKAKAIDAIKQNMENVMETSSDILLNSSNQEIAIMYQKGIDEIAVDFYKNFFKTSAEPLGMTNARIVTFVQANIPTDDLAKVYASKVKTKLLKEKVKKLSGKPTLGGKSKKIDSMFGKPFKEPEFNLLKALTAQAPPTDLITAISTKAKGELFTKIEMLLAHDLDSPIKQKTLELIVKQTTLKELKEFPDYAFQTVYSEVLLDTRKTMEGIQAAVDQFKGKALTQGLKNVVDNLAQEAAIEAGKLEIVGADSLFKFAKTKNRKATKKSIKEAAEKYANDKVDAIIAERLADKDFLWIRDKKYWSYEHLDNEEFEAQVLYFTQKWLQGNLNSAYHSVDQIVDIVNSINVKKMIRSIPKIVPEIEKKSRLLDLDHSGILSIIQNARNNRPLVKKVKTVKMSSLSKPIKKGVSLKVNKKDFPTSLDELKIKKRLGGSTGAELVEDEQGRLFVRKKGASADHLREEFRAEESYRAAGVNVPDSVLYETDSGPVKLSKYLADAKPLSELKGEARKKAVEKIREDFGTDAVFGNWDVGGLELDNIMVDKAGKIWRIDVGGSFRYRAQGALKTAKQFQAAPIELFTMDATIEAAPGVTSSSAQVFRGMKHADKIKSLERLLANRNVILDSIDDIDLKKIIAARMDEAEDIVQTAYALVDDGYNMETWVKNVNFHAVKMDYEGIFKKNPKRMKSTGGNVTKLEDENGVPWDNIRGEGSLSVEVKDYIENAGGDWDIISRWAEEQAGGSWYGRPQAMKYYTVKQKGGDFGSFYWRDGVGGAKEYYERMIGDIKSLIASRTGISPTTSKAEHILDVTWEAWQAFNTQFLRRVAFKNNDQVGKVITLMRTEDIVVMRLNKVGKGAKQARMQRGALESTSIYRETYIAGSELTVQKVPHHRIFGNYFMEQKPGRGSGLFMSDSENEFIALLDDIPFDYL